MSAVQLNAVKAIKIIAAVKAKTKTGLLFFISSSFLLKVIVFYFLSYYTWVFSHPY
jgi:hypothetical protein